MLVLSISGFPLHVCRLLNDFIGLWNSYITDTWSSKSLPAHFPIKNNYGFYHHCPHTYVLQAWAHWSNHLLKIILMGKCCVHHEQFTRQVGRVASSPLLSDLKITSPLFFFITGPLRALKSLPEKRVSAKCGDKTPGVPDCFRLSGNHLPKHVHITHFLAQFHCLLNGICKLL